MRNMDGVQCNPAVGACQTGEQTNVERQQNKEEQGGELDDKVVKECVAHCLTGTYRHAVRMHTQPGHQRTLTVVRDDPRQQLLHHQAFQVLVRQDEVAVHEMVARSSLGSRGAGVVELPKDVLQGRGDGITKPDSCWKMSMQPQHVHASKLPQTLHHATPYRANGHAPVAAVMPSCTAPASPPCSAAITASSGT